MWFDAYENERGGVQNGGIKIDLYKIDYNSFDEKGMVLTTQEYSEIFGDTGSQSEATYNPRMFVRDKQSKNLYIPLELHESSGTQNCEIQLDEAGEEVSRQCRDNNSSKAMFWWYSVLDINPNQGIQELESHNFLDILKQDKNIAYDDRYLNARDLMPRVGYIKKWGTTKIFMLNGVFGHATTLWSESKDEVYIPLWDNDSISFE